MYSISTNVPEFRLGTNKSEFTKSIKSSPWVKSTPWTQISMTLGQKKKLLCCPLPTDRKMRKNWVRFFFFFLCQIWAKNLLKFVFNGLKKHLHDLYICVLTAFRPSFPHLETLKKILENSTLSRYVKKKKKKKKKIPTDRPNF